MKTRTQFSIALFGCVALAAVQLAPGLFVGPSLDASVFLLVGERVLHGARPYVDLWDHKPPGIYGVEALLISTLGPLVGPWPAVWLGSVVAYAGVGVAVLSVLWARVTLTAAVAGALLTVGVAAAWPFSLGGGLTDGFAAAFASAALLVACRAGRAGDWLPVGVLIGLACTISLWSLAVAGGITVIALRLGGPRAAVLTAAGAAIVGIALLIASAALGILPDMADALVAYSGAYRASTEGAAVPPTFEPSARLWAWYAANSLALAVPATVGYIVAARSDRTSALFLGLTTWITLRVLFIVLGGRLYGHYLLLLMAPLGVLAGIGLDQLTHISGRATRRLAIAGTGAAVAVSLAAIYASVSISVPDAAEFRDRDVAAAEWITENTLPGDPIFIWGNAPRVYQLSHAIPASRYVYLLPLLMPGWVSVARVDEVRTELASSRPCIIIDAGSEMPGSAGLPSLLIPRPLSASERRVDILDPLRMYVADRYRRVATVDGWPMYEPRSGQCG